MKKKIIAAFESDRFSKSTLDYAIDIAKSTDSLIVGAFLRAVPNMGFGYPITMGENWGEAYAYSAFLDDEKKKAKLNTDLFTSICESTGVSFKVEHQEYSPVEHLIHMSAFADVIIVDSKTNYDSLIPGNVSTALKDVLADAHCPVLVVPMDFHPIRKLQLTYDGTPSSTYAMKMMHYVFPEWKSLPVNVVTVNTSSSNHLPENHFIHDFLKRHFPNAEIVVLNGEIEKSIIDFFSKESDHSVITMGAFGRSALSRLFKQSLANKIIEEIKVPLFITHQ